jgi:hypothetical protein
MLPREPPANRIIRARPRQLLRLTRKYYAHHHRTPPSEIMRQNANRREEHQATSDSHPKALRQKSLVEMVWFDQREHEGSAVRKVGVVGQPEGKCSREE